MWIWTFQTFRKLMWSWWSYFQKAVSKEESSICKVVGNAGRAFSFHKREAASSEKKNTGLVQTSWESHLVRCHLLRFQWIFIFRSPDGVQALSESGVFLRCCVNPSLFPEVWQHKGWLAAPDEDLSTEIKGSFWRHLSKRWNLQVRCDTLRLSSPWSTLWKDYFTKAWLFLIEAK